MKVAATSEVYFWKYDIAASETTQAESKILVVEKKSDDTYCLITTKDNTYATVYGDYTVTQALEFNSDNVEVVEESADTEIPKHYVYKNRHPGYNYILSETLIPTISLNLKDWGLKIEDFADIKIGASAEDMMTGKIAMRSTIHPGAVEYRAVAVDKNNKGYRLANVGYLTNVNLGVAQVNKDGRICVYKPETQGIDRAVDKSVVTINLPDVAKNFLNFKNAKVIVEYSYMYNQHTLTTTMDGPLAIPTGNVYTVGDKDTRTIEDVDWSKGVSFDVDLPNTMYKLDNGTITQDTNGTLQINQIKVTKITIVVGNMTLFVRNYY